MSEKENEPNSWRYYDDSSLVTLLRHDTWDPQTAVSLICEIDPRHSETFEPRIYYNTPLVEAFMIDETQPFWKIKLLSTNKKAHVPRCWYRDIDDIQAASMDWDRRWEEWQDRPDPYVSLDDEITPQNEAQRRFVDVLDIYFSSPPHKTNPIRSPRYFVDWAVSKGIEIRWLEWAKARGYLVEDSTESQLKTNEEQLRVTPSDKRKQEGLQAAIEILNQKHANGELNDWQDFKRCMRKAEIIALVRDSPKDYPNCDKTKPPLNNDQAQTTKDREPTLSRSFPDFTKDATILAEYERLTDKD